MWQDVHSPNGLMGLNRSASCDTAIPRNHGAAIKHLRTQANIIPVAVLFCARGLWCLRRRAASVSAVVYNRCRAMVRHRLLT